MSLLLDFLCLWWRLHGLEYLKLMHVALASEKTPLWVSG